MLRMTEEGSPFLTDNGNEILDCHFPDGIQDPTALELALDAIPGIVESGLFINLAHAVVIGYPDGRCEVREKA
jgi:ribose 5-phosphate isomerase A